MFLKCWYEFVLHGNAHFSLIFKKAVHFTGAQGTKHYILCVLLESLHVFFPLILTERVWRHGLDDGRHLNVRSKVFSDSPHASISSPSNIGGSKLTTASYVSPVGKDTTVESTGVTLNVTSLEKSNAQAYVSTLRSLDRDSRSSGHTVLPRARRLGRDTGRNTGARENLTLWSAYPCPEPASSPAGPQLKHNKQGLRLLNINVASIRINVVI